MPYKDPEKRRENRRKYREANRERLNAYSRKYREARRDDINATGRKYYLANREKMLASSRKWALDHPERMTEYQRKHRADNLERVRDQARRWAKDNPDTIKKNSLKYREAHVERLRATAAARHRHRRKTDTQFRLAYILRSRMTTALRFHFKAGSAVRDLGCTIDEFKQHLENHFYGEMSWDNHGSHWHIDHIRPLCSFDLEDRGQFLQACHWSNMQPLTAVENLAKGGRWGRETRLRNSA